MSTELRLMHQIDLDNGAWEGMEQHFAAMLRTSLQRYSVHHHLAEAMHDPAPEMQMALHRLATPACDLRRWHGLPVPQQPAFLRDRLRLRCARRWQIDRVLNWNRVGDTTAARLAAQLEVPSCYWEHGAAWAARPPSTDRAFGEAFDLYLTNSEAGRQMLRQRWQVRGEIRVCAPGVMLPGGALSTVPRELDPSRPLRLGFSARLHAVKGAVLAVHTLHRLRAHGVDAELWFAAEGAELEAVEQQAARLALKPHLHRSGPLPAMDPFHAAIDLLIQPALSDPYPLSCAQALSAGVPVIATCVDGVPEVLRDGVDGHCVAPTLPLSRYAEFGGQAQSVPALVYDPQRALLDVPRLPDPDALAQAVADIAGDPARYRQFSAAALRAYDQRLSIARQTRRLIELLAQQVPCAGLASFSLETQN